MANGFGAGFSQGLSGVLTQGLPLIIGQRAQEAKLKQDEEELKVRKKLVEAQSEHLAAQAQKTLRELLVQQALSQMVPGLPGASEAAPRTGALLEPEAAGTDPGTRLTGRGQLAQLLIGGGQTGEALKLFPEMTRESPEAMGERTRRTVEASGFGHLLGPQGAPGAAGGTPTAAPWPSAQPGAAGATAGGGNGAPAGTPLGPTQGMPMGPASQWRPTINLGADGKVSVSIAGQPTAFQVSQVDLTDEQGFVQKHERVFDPASGRVVNVYPIGPKVPPEFMQKAMAQVRAAIPDAPKEVQARAAGQLLGMEGRTRAEFLTQLEATNATFKQARTGKAGAGASSVSSAVDAANAAEVKQKAAEAEASTRARLETERKHGPVPTAAQPKLQMLEAAERLAGEIEAGFKPEYVGKGFASFKKPYEAMERQVAHGSGAYERIAPGGLAGAMREFLGTASAEEVTFRRNVVDVMDLLLRARSGAAITEQEYQRMKSALFSLTDEPTSFKAGLARFQKELGAQIKDLLKSSTQSASEKLAERAAAGQAAPTKATEPAAPIFKQTMVLRGPDGRSGKLAPGYPVPKGWTVVGPHPGGK